MYYTLHARLKKTEPDYKSDLNLFQTDPVQHDSDQANSGQTNPASPVSTLNNPICIENVLTLSPAQWEKQKVSLRFPPYAGLENTIIRSCKAEIYPRYISGSLCIPDRKRLLETSFCFTFYINESSIVFVSEDSVPDRIIETMIHRYESQDMSPELFLYGFFSEFLTDDMELLESYERKLFLLEENAMRGNIHDLMPRLLKNKRELTRLRNYFEQIDDMAGQLQGKMFYCRATSGTILIRNGCSCFSSSVTGPAVSSRWHSSPSITARPCGILNRRNPTTSRIKQCS